MKEPINRASEFEKTLAQQSSQRYVLRLYVVGMTTRSMEAIASIRRICEEHLKGRYEIEVVDLYQHPELAKEREVIVAPTLVKELPKPLRRLIGSLADEKRVLKGLDILPKT